MKLSGQGDEAATALRQALLLQPENAEAHNALGEVLAAKGEWAAAIDEYRAAIRQAPALAVAYGNLGAALVETDQLREAVAACHKALELQPDYPEALNNLAAALLKLEWMGPAEQAVRRALELRPDYPTAMENLARLLIKSGRAEAGMEEMLRLYRVNEGNPLYAAKVSESYESLGQLDDALVWAQRVIDLNPESIDSQTRLANLLREAGQHKAAEEHYARMLEMAANHAGYPVANLYLGLSQCRRYTQMDDPVLGRIEKLLEEQGKITQDERANLHFALGKIYNDLKDYAQAFEHYAQANRLEHEQVEFDRVKFEGEVDEIIATFDEAYFAAHGTANSSELPIDIVGMPRSGTTLTEQIISSHPRVHGAGELTFWSTQRAHALPQFPHAVTRAMAEELGNYYVQHLQAFSATAWRVTDKMPGNFLYAGLIHQALPRARIIHCKRHPVDTCLSIFFQRFNRGHRYAFDLDDLAFYYRQYRRLMAHWKKVLPPENYFEVQYEDLVSNQEKVSRELIAFCGLDWDDQCLEFYKSERKVQTASHWQVRQPIYKTSKERWRNYEPYIGPLLELLQEEE